MRGVVQRWVTGLPGWPGAPMALASALLFGASTPLAKLLLGSIEPLMLAALLYLGAGLGLMLLAGPVRRAGIVPREAAIGRADAPWLALSTIAGGMVGPVLLLLGLARSEAASASLLLNLESLLTLAIAWLVTRENVDRRLLIGAGAILAGAVVLAWQGRGPTLDAGALLIALACLAWAIDNNLTRRIASADPVQITIVKGLVAGSVNLALALALGGALPDPGTILAALFVGLAGYGVSIALFVAALRHLGTARTGAYFATAPFLGAVLAVLLLAEPITAQLLLGGGLMLVGVWLHLCERHEHLHAHEPIEHEHLHWHDEHHRHVHGPNDPPGEPHSHRHRHAALVHSHPHYPDLHHRHEHS